MINSCIRFGTVLLLAYVVFVCFADDEERPAQGRRADPAEGGVRDVEVTDAPVVHGGIPNEARAKELQDEIERLQGELAELKKRYDIHSRMLRPFGFAIGMLNELIRNPNPDVRVAVIRKQAEKQCFPLITGNPGKYYGMQDSDPRVRAAATEAQHSFDEQRREYYQKYKSLNPPGTKSSKGENPSR